MLAVLMCSSKVGSSSWADARGRGEIHVTGMVEGDLVEICITTDIGPFENKHLVESVSENRKISIPEWATRIMVSHKEAAGGKVCVDLR
jgi:hypothetical protein